MTNISSANFGGMLFIHTKKISFFVDVKSNWVLSGEVKDGYRYKSIETGNYTTWQNGASYKKTYYKINTSIGESYHRKVFDIGVAKNLKEFTVYLGIGIYRLKTEDMLQTITSTYNHTHYEILGYDETSPTEIYTTYDVLRVKYKNELNGAFGLIYNINHFSIGGGFDSKPTGLNLMMGYNF